MSTLTGNNQPLFVVDGVPIINSYGDAGAYSGTDYGNSAMDINPSDIENISILKGANAAALYGSRAVNGVVLITTKTGKLRSGSKKGLGVSFETNWQWSNPLKLPNYQDKYGQGYGGKFAYYDGAWGGINDGIDESWGPALDYVVQSEDLVPDSEGNPGRLEWAVDEGYPQTAGQILSLPQFDSPYDAVNDVRTPTPFISHPDNVKDVFETGLAITNTLTLFGANEDGDFRLSIGDQNVKGMIPNTDLRKTNITLAAGYNLAEKLRASGSVSYIHNNSDNIMSAGYTSAGILQSLSQWFGRQVDTHALKDRWQEPDPLNPGENFNWNHSYHDNPYWTVNKNTNSRTRNRVLGNMNLKWDITNYLSLDGMAGIDFYSQEVMEVRAKGSHDWRDGRFSNYLNTRSSTIARARLNFNKTFGDLSVVALLGGEYNGYNYHSNNTYVSKLIIPDLYAVSNAAAPATTGMSTTQTALQSVYAQVNLGFRNWLFLDLTGRNDWSSTLPVDNNSYFYPSASLGLVLTEALGMQSNVLSFLKLRGSYAEVGGTAGAYMLNGTFGAGNPFNGNPSLTYTNTLPPLSLLPQRKKSIEAGLDIKFLNNRLRLDATYYKENTINQIINLDISRMSGFNTTTINAGDIQNQGIEIILGATPVQQTKFRWDIMFNYARNRNMVNELYTNEITGEEMNSYGLYNGSWGAYVYARKGEPYGQMFGHDIVRENAINHYLDDDETVLDYVEYTGRPVVTTSGRYIRTPGNTLLGNVMPDFFGGLNNSFSYGKLSASFLVDFRVGGVQYSITDWFGNYAGVMEVTAATNANGMNVRDDVADGGGVLIDDAVYGYVTSDGTIQLTDADGNDVTTGVTSDTYVSALTYYEGDYWGKPGLSVYDASFVKLREVVLGYTFTDVAPWLSAINVSLVGRNLWLIHSNMPHVDPENGLSAGNNSVGMNSTPTPTARTFGFNVKLSF
ncbi:MAG: SusC/RagA family TonB-linked outer membrane protein [Bacteroidales bacterium]|nr:SusC/RagA family TonB-linked outer membrane protein [Bacteroidales bacterium]